MNRRDTLAILALAALAPVPLLAQPQIYPSKPILVLVGAPAGSVPDVMTRPVAQRLSALLGQPVVVDNRPGAGGSLSMAALTRSAPDGYTLALATMSQAVFNSYLFAKLPYDPRADLEPVAPLVSGAMVLAAHPSFRGRTLAELTDIARSQDGKLFIAVPQLGTPPHIVALLLNHTVGANVTLVPHKSGAEAINAVVSGEIPLVIDAPTLIASHVQSGRLRALAVTGRQREPLLPDIPTATEAGTDMQAEAWIGLVAPKGTPPEIIQRLNRALASVMATQDMRSQMTAMGFRTLESTPQEFAQLIHDEHLKWGETIRQSGLKL